MPSLIWAGLPTKHKEPGDHTSLSCCLRNNLSYFLFLFQSSSSVKFNWKTKASLGAATEEPAVTICLDSFCGAQLPVIEQIIVIFGSFLSTHNC